MSEAHNLDRFDSEIYEALAASQLDRRKDLLKRFDANMAAGLFGGRPGSFEEWLGSSGGSVKVVNGVRVAFLPIETWNELRVRFA